MSLLALPHEIILDIIQFATPESQVNLRRVCTRIRELVDSLIKNIDFRSATKQNDLITIIHLANTRVYKPYEWYFALCKACSNGNLPLVRLAIANGASDWDDSLDDTHERDNKKIIEWVSLRTKRSIECWNEGLSLACKSGHAHVAELMIKLGANSLDEELEYVCESGYLSIFKLLVRYTGCSETTFEDVCYYGHIPIILYIMSNGDKYDVNKGLHQACCGGHMSTVELMISLGANDWDGGLFNACIGNHLAIVKLIIERGATDIKSCLERDQSVEIRDYLESTLGSWI